MGEISRPNFSLPIPITADHDVEYFECGEAPLDYWLKKRAFKNQTSGASRTFVVCIETRVVGYYCLSAGAIAREAAPKSARRNMPDPLPVLLLGRLAIDRNFQGHGLGRALLRDAMLRALNVSEEAGVFAILVHAISDEAKRFYLACGFVESSLQPMTMLMTIETIRTIMAE